MTSICEIDPEHVNSPNRNSDRSFSTDMEALMNAFGAKQRGFETLKCPECGAAIPVSDAIAARVEEEALIEWNARDAKQREQFAEAERAFVDRKAGLEREVNERVESAVLDRLREVEAKARSSIALELADLNRQIKEKSEQVEAAREVELALRAERRVLEERSKAVDVEVGRRIDAERQHIEASVVLRLGEEYRLRIADKEKALQDVRKANEELNRKLQQGSEQSRGEVLELELETILRNAFPTDEIAPVPKGISGADLVHKVVSRSGVMCGTIVWEAKRTKNWSDSWVAKVRDNQRAIKAELAVIVSEALPSDCRHFTQVGGVWITNPQCAINLALALRQQLAEVALARNSAQGKQGKLEVLYEYLTGPEFRQRVEVIVETFTDMQVDLQEERRSFERRWAKREKQLQRVIGSTAEIRHAGGATNMLVRDGKLGQSLAAALGDKPVALMRGHGNVVVGPNVRVATARAIFTDENARMQAVALSFGGPVNYISPAEGALRDREPSDPARAWDLWKANVMKKPN